jgi:hypothetical protein
MSAQAHHNPGVHNNTRNWTQACGNKGEGGEGRGMRTRTQTISWLSAKSPVAALMPKWYPAGKYTSGAKKQVVHSFFPSVSSSTLRLCACGTAGLQLALPTKASTALYLATVANAGKGIVFFVAKRGGAGGQLLVSAIAVVVVIDGTIVHHARDVGSSALQKAGDSPVRRRGCTQAHKGEGKAAADVHGGAAGCCRCQRRYRGP